MNYRYDHINNIIRISNKTSKLSRIIGYILLSIMFGWFCFVLVDSIFITRDIEKLKVLFMLVFFVPLCISLFLSYTETTFYLERKFVVHKRTIVFTRTRIIPFHQITSLGSKHTHHHYGGLGEHWENRGSHLSTYITTRNKKFYKVFEANGLFGAIYASRYKKLKKATGL